MSNIKKAYAMLTTEESHRNIVKTTDERRDVIVFLATPAMKSGKITCTHCSKSRYEAEDCFLLIGMRIGGCKRGKTTEKIPIEKTEGMDAVAHQVGESQARATTTTSKVATSGGPHPGATNVGWAAHAIAHNDGRKYFSSVQLYSMIATGILGLSQEQWNSLLTLLNNNNSFSSSEKLTGKICDIWILDSKCSRHMTGRKDFLKNIKPTLPYVFGLPNRDEATGIRECISES